MHLSVFPHKTPLKLQQRNFFLILGENLKKQRNRKGDSRKRDVNRILAAGKQTTDEPSDK